MTWSGSLVAFEGIDGAGTTSQLAPAADFCAERGRPAWVTCEPSQSPCGQLARAYLRAPEGADEATMALLFATDRLMHLQHEVRPRLAAGALVLCDRYLLSSYAYQTTGPADLDAAWVAAINAKAPPADLTLFFEVNPSVAKARRLARAGVVERFDGDGRQVRVADAYRHFADAAARAGQRVVRIDANADLPHVRRQVQRALGDYLAAPEGGARP